MIDASGVCVLETLTSALWAGAAHLGASAVALLRTRAASTSLYARVAAAKTIPDNAHIPSASPCAVMCLHTHRITCVRALRLIIQRARSSLCFGARNVLCLCGVCNGMCCVLQKLAPFSLLPAAALHGQFRTHVRARSKRFRSVQPYIPSMLNWRDRLP